MLRLIELDGDRVVVGRDAGNDLALPWDVEVSRVHALLERLGGSWTVVDDDLSRNGTFVNGQRLRGRRRLNDRDLLRVGATEVLFRDPAAEAGETPRVSAREEVAGITPGQRRVLVALCRPLLDVVGARRNAAFEFGAGAGAGHLDGGRAQPPEGAVQDIRAPGPAAEPQARGARAARDGLGRRRSSGPDRRSLAEGVARPPRWGMDVAPDRADAGRMSVPEPGQIEHGGIG